MMIYTAVLTLCTLLVYGEKAEARKEYAKRIPNGSLFSNLNALAHEDSADGGRLNVFGEAFEQANGTWTLELCRGDADGDGQTNGEEMGDPCCVYFEGDTPTFSEGMSHPANASSMVDQAILDKWVCGYFPDSDSDSLTTLAPEATLSDDDPDSQLTPSPEPSLSAHIRRGTIVALGTSLLVLFCL